MFFLYMLFTCISHALPNHHAVSMRAGSFRSRVTVSITPIRNTLLRSSRCNDREHRHLSALKKFLFYQAQVHMQGICVLGYFRKFMENGIERCLYWNKILKSRYSVFLIHIFQELFEVTSYYVVSRLAQRLTI